MTIIIEFKQNLKEYYEIVDEARPLSSHFLIRIYKPLHFSQLAFIVLLMINLQRLASIPDHWAVTHCIIHILIWFEPFHH